MRGENAHSWLGRRSSLPLRAGVLVAVVAVLGGCASVPKNVLPPPGPLKAEGEAGPDEADASAVYLLRRQEVTLTHVGSKWSTTKVHHERMLILTEKGIQRASKHLRIPDWEELVAFEARTISPEGAVDDVQPEAVIEDEARYTEKSVATRTFRFPRAAVGSILEVRWAVHSTHLSDEFYEPIAVELPTRHFEQVFFIEQAMRPDLLVRQATPAIDYVRKGPSGFQEIRFAMNNVAADRSEFYSPPTADRVPWWLLRVIDYRDGVNVVRLNDTWVRALSWRLQEKLLKGKDMEGVEPVGVSACNGDRDCIASALLRALRERSHFGGFADFLTARPLKEVLASRSANSDEKALLLWQMFKNAGVDAYFGVTARGDRGAIVEDFPSSYWVDHSVLYLPATTTAPAHFIDPSCEACTLGELPPWSIGRRAVVVDHTAGEWGTALRVTPKSRKRGASPLLTLTGKLALVGIRHRTVDVTIESNGDVVVATEEVRDGDDTVGRDRTQRFDGDDVVRRTLVAAIRDEVAEGAILEDLTIIPCDVTIPRCVRRYRYRLPGLAIALPEQGQWLVPLTMLRSATADELEVVRKTPRRHAIRLPANNDGGETVILHPPEGHRFDLVDGGRRAEQVDQLIMSAAVKVNEEGALVVERRFLLATGEAPASRWSTWQKAAAPFIALRHRMAVARKVEVASPTLPPAAKAPLSSSLSVGLEDGVEAPEDVGDAP